MVIFLMIHVSGMFYAGVSYIIDKFSKKCVAKPIVGGEFDSLPVTATKARLKSPKEFFNFDNLSKYPYQYMGEVRRMWSFILKFLDKWHIS